MPEPLSQEDTLGCPRVAHLGGTVTSLMCSRMVCPASRFGTRACHDGPVNRGLACVLVFALGLVSLAACSSAPTPSPSLGPTSPNPSPSVFYSLIGPPPKNCSVAPPLTIIDAFGPALGTSPAWAVGFMAEGGRDVLHTSSTRSTVALGHTVSTGRSSGSLSPDTRRGLLSPDARCPTAIPYGFNSEATTPPPRPCSIRRVPACQVPVI